MRIEHFAVWTRDLERLRAFYERYFEVTSGERYESATTLGFVSYFLTFSSGGARLELMLLPELAPAPSQPAAGYPHYALSVGSREKVESLTERMRADGVQIVSEARTTGDGYFESVVADPDGNLIELTV
ncbi:MAG: VOC family protein [Gemmatimonadaceae bacterium]